MLLTENLAVRLHEWLDRETEEPDLVPRFRRLWTEPRVRPAAPKPPGLRRLLALRDRPALETPRGA